MFRILLFLGVTFLLSELSQAAEWSLKGSLDQTLSYDDNVLMLRSNQKPLNPEDSRGSFQYRLLPGLTFQHKTDVSEFHADALYGTQIYTDIEGLDQKIQNYGLGGVYKTEQFDWGVNANYSVTPSRNTAVQNSGDFKNNSDKTTWTVSPYLEYKINELNSLVLTANYAETTFSASTVNTKNGVVDNSFNPNDTTLVDLAWQRDWSEKYSTEISVFYSNFNSPFKSATGSAAKSSFDTVGINFSNTYLWSENWKLLGTIGVRNTDSTDTTINNGDSSSSFGFLADAEVNYTGENITSGINFNRSLTPSNQGNLQEQTSVGLNFNYKIAEKLSTAFTTNYLQSTLVNQKDGQEREDIIFQPTVNWHVLPDWTLSGGYRYRTQDLQFQNAPNNSGVSDSNLFFMSINYNWQGLNLKRSPWN